MRIIRFSRRHTPVAVLPHEKPQGSLCRNKNNSHQQVSEGKLMIDPVRRCRGTVGQPPGFCREKVRANKSDQPDNRQKSEAHLPDLQRSLSSRTCGLKQNAKHGWPRSLPQLCVMDARVGGETQTSHPRFFNLELFSALGAGFFQMQCAERRPQIEFLAAACRESGAGLRTRRALLPISCIR